MNIGEEKRVVTIEPIEDPVPPRRPPRRDNEPAKVAPEPVRTTEEQEVGGR